MSTGTPKDLESQLGYNEVKEEEPTSRSDQELPAGKRLSAKLRVKSNSQNVNNDDAHQTEAEAEAELGHINKKQFFHIFIVFLFLPPQKHLRKKNKKDTKIKK